MMSLKHRIKCSSIILVLNTQSNAKHWNLWIMNFLNEIFTNYDKYEVSCSTATQANISTICPRANTNRVFEKSHSHCSINAAIHVLNTHIIIPVCNIKFIIYGKTLQQESEANNLNSAWNLQYWTQYFYICSRLFPTWTTSIWLLM